MTVEAINRFSTASTSEVLMTALQRNLGSEQLVASLGELTTVLPAAVALASAIVRTTPTLVHKPSLHVLVVAPAHLVVDQGRWLQLATDLLERAYPIKISVANEADALIPESPLSALISHMPGASFVDLAEGITLGAPDMIYAPFMRMPCGPVALPCLNWVGRATSAGIPIAASAINPLEACILAACVNSGRLGQARKTEAAHVGNREVHFEISAPTVSARRDPAIGILAAEWVARLMGAQKSGKAALDAFLQDPDSTEAAKRIAGAAEDLGTAVIGRWSELCVSLVGARPS